MVISGAGKDITKLLGAEFAPTSNRLNGDQADPLKSSKEFKSLFSDRLGNNSASTASYRSAAVPAAKAPVKAATYSKTKNVEEPVPQTEPKLVQPQAEPQPSAPVKETTTVEKYDEIESTHPQINAEEGAMLKFLYSMQTELGVEPEKVVEAMASLNAEALVKPPEETMGMVLENLQLNPEQFVKAEELYQVMLKETAQASMGQMLYENQQSVDFAVVGPEQLKLQKLMKSLDDLSKSFFDTKPKKVVDPKLVQQFAVDPKFAKELIINEPEQAKQILVSEPRLARELAAAEPKLFQKLVSDDPMFAQVLVAKDPQLIQKVAESDPQLAQQLTIIAAEPTPMPKEAALFGASAMGAGSAAKLATTEKVKVEGASPNEKAMSIDELLGHLNVEGFEVTTQPANAQESGEEGFYNEEEQTFSDLNAGQLGQKNEILNTTNNARPGAPLIRTTDEAANTRQLVETAQLLAQKGGGNMKIQLRPDGLGYVELKVGVNAGKVDIQMITENNEVKRLLESGLSELKAGLTQHKLSLESVQVDTSNKTNPGFDNMFGQDRDTAREFLEQFRQFNQNRREAGFDFGAGNYSARSKKLRPEDVKYASAKSKASSRRLDLVA